MTMIETLTSLRPPSIQTIKAISQPEKSPFNKLKPKPLRMDSMLRTRKLSRICGSKMLVCPSTQAMISVPTMFATKTTAHKRSTFLRHATLRRASSGRIGVKVFSVNSCCRPMMTIRKPTEYPSFAMSGFH